MWSCGTRRHLATAFVTNRLSNTLPISRFKKSILLYPLSLPNNNNNQQRLYFYNGKNYNNDEIIIDYSSLSPLYMSANDDSNDSDSDSDDDNDTKNKIINVRTKSWNIPGLKKEVIRLGMRCHKKVSKASTRYQNAQQEVERLTSPSSSLLNITLEELENCPNNVDQLKLEFEELQQRLVKFNQLEVLLQEVTTGNKKKSNSLPDHILDLIEELNVNDEPPKRQERGPGKKQKGPKHMGSFRLPYRRFYSENNTEIRVGKQAQDNDELSCNPKHRDGPDWWMHASGCPGSHVVIRCQDENLNSDVIMDAAALAARQSKCTGSIIKVSLTRCRNVKKPPGAKPGLVQLTGGVKTIVVNMKEAEKRLERLDKTVLVN